MGEYASKEAHSRVGPPAHGVARPYWQEDYGWDERHNYRGWWVPVVLLLIFVLAFAHYKGAW